MKNDRLNHACYLWAFSAITASPGAKAPCSDMSRHGLPVRNRHITPFTSRRRSGIGLRSHGGSNGSVIARS
ncbi:hypothetical protein [Streptomyces sp. NPDC056227]|uniref:hypothetical protein n=1 Tax=Streptomyces sp. NPDC056227 TaxID=3345753 RepID=UPI0035DAFAA1